MNYCIMVKFDDFDERLVIVVLLAGKTLRERHMYIVFTNSLIMTIHIWKIENYNFFILLKTKMRICMRESTEEWCGIK